ncbi:hypothetical protein HDU86_007894 [Geranomyces michiganensis]|nr:hypothetical protein HDU86_007894 [Geranomyces michiganensis]
MLKATTPVVVLLLGWIMGTEKPNVAVLGKVFVIVFGVALASFGEINFVVIGVIFQALGIIFEAARLVMVQKLLHQYKMDPLCSLYHFAPVCAVMNGLACIVFEGSLLNVEAFATIGPATLLANACVAFALNCAVVFLIGKTSSLVMCLSGIAKDIILVVVSSIVWATPIGGWQIIGYGITLAGMVWYKNLSLFNGNRFYSILPQSMNEKQQPSTISRRLCVIAASAVLIFTTLCFLWYSEGSRDTQTFDGEISPKPQAALHPLPGSRLPTPAVVTKPLLSPDSRLATQAGATKPRPTPDSLLTTPAVVKKPRPSPDSLLTTPAVVTKPRPSLDSPLATPAVVKKPRPSPDSRLATPAVVKKPRPSPDSRLTTPAMAKKPAAKPAVARPAPILAYRPEHCLLANSNGGGPSRMVVVSQHGENSTWLPDVHASPVVVYEKIGTNRSAEHVVPNYGNEASTFIKFILDNYDCLPDKTAFVHGHRTSWHTAKPMDKILNEMSWDRAEFFKLPAAVRGKTDVARYPPDRSIKESVPVELHIFWNRWFKAKYGPVPQRVEAQCCAQFVASRQRIRLNSWDWYKDIYDWLVSEEIHSYWSGRALEYSWHIMFGEKPIEPLWKCPHVPGFRGPQDVLVKVLDEEVSVVLHPQPPPDPLPLTKTVRHIRPETGPAPLYPATILRLRKEERVAKLPNIKNGEGNFNDKVMQVYEVHKRGPEEHESAWIVGIQLANLLLIHAMCLGTLLNYKMRNFENKRLGELDQLHARECARGPEIDVRLFDKSETNKWEEILVWTMKRANAVNKLVLVKEWFSRYKSIRGAVNRKTTDMRIENLSMQKAGVPAIYYDAMTNPEGTLCAGDDWAKKGDNISVNGPWWSVVADLVSWKGDCAASQSRWAISSPCLADALKRRRMRQQNARKCRLRLPKQVLAR